MDRRYDSMTADAVPGNCEREQILGLLVPRFLAFLL
jgi:hypothetical protein